MDLFAIGSIPMLPVTPCFLVGGVITGPDKKKKTYHPHTVKTSAGMTGRLGDVCLPTRA